MPWFKVDDALYGHPKWLRTPPAARALWVTAGSWCAAQLTDGVVPAHVLPTLGGTTRAARELVDAGLWTTVDNGWQFHAWLEFQPSAEQVEAERAAARERQQRARDKARESRPRHAVTHGEVTPVVTVPPTRPDPTSSDNPPLPPKRRPRKRTTEPAKTEPPNPSAHLPSVSDLNLPKLSEDELSHYEFHVIEGGAA
jgi:hypothetical protein